MLSRVVCLENLCAFPKLHLFRDTQKDLNTYNWRYMYVITNGWRHFILYMVIHLFNSSVNGYKVSSTNAHQITINLKTNKKFKTIKNL